MGISTKIGLTKVTQEVVILLPVVLIFLSEILQVSHKDISSVIKVGAVFYMFVYALLKSRFHGSILVTILLFTPFFLYGILHSFSLKAALTEAIRYLFPIAILLYGFAIRHQFKFLVKVFIIFVLFNDAVQIFNYFNWIRGVDQWFYNYSPDGTRYYNASSGFIRATGIVAFFGLFGFINLIAFFLARKYYEGKRKKLLLAIFVISLFLSFSYKTIGTLALLLFFQYKSKLKFFRVVAVLFVVALVAIPNTLADMGDNLVYRVREYVTEGNSARGESYRVMVSDMLDLNLFGRGVGSFGGPSSVTYNSPVYYDRNFKWYSTTNLATTDTYYPHLLVEMGIIGGFFYLLILITPLIFLKWERDKFSMALIIYVALFFDSLFSYSLNNVAFLAVSLLFIYPLYYFDSKNEETLVTSEQSN